MSSGTDRKTPASYSGPDALAQSNDLHRRVRRFAALCDEAPLVPPPDAESFEALALDVARFQAEHSPAYQRLLRHFGCKLDSVAALPPVPVEAFRFTRVAVHPRELDTTVFVTSGTTSQHTGRHPVRELETYRDLALRLARRALFGTMKKAVVVALAPVPGHPPASSLGHMMRLFMQAFDGRALSRDPTGAAFDVDAPGRWLLSAGDVDTQALQRAAQLAKHRSEPMVLLTSSFALAATLDALDGERVQMPQKSVVMVTGGFKGRRVRLDPARLREKAQKALGIAAEDIVGEYGMTELTSQMYEVPPPRAARSAALDNPAVSTGSFWPADGGPGLFHSPPWLRVTAVDPATYRPVPGGQPGLARFVDLGNVDSALCIVTDDLIVEREDGIQLLGRRSRAETRGCSLPYEGLLTSEPRGVAASSGPQKRASS